MRTWRERLDARIGRCSGCDGRTWDSKCRQCDDEQENAA